MLVYVLVSDTKEECDLYTNAKHINVIFAVQGYAPFLGLIYIYFLFEMQAL